MANESKFTNLSKIFRPRNIISILLLAAAGWAGPEWLGLTPKPLQYSCVENNERIIAAFWSRGIFGPVVVEQALLSNGETLNPTLQSDPFDLDPTTLTQTLKTVSRQSGAVTSSISISETEEGLACNQIIGQELNSNKIPR